MKDFDHDDTEETRRISAQAVTWLQIMQQLAPALADRKALAAWLLKSPLHVREALVARALDRHLSGSDAFANFDLEKVLAAARGPDNIVEFPARPSRASDLSSPPRLLRRKRQMRVAIAASLFCICTALGTVTITAPSRADANYSTAIGEQKTFVLADGSVVDLMPHSEIRVRYSRNQRNIELVAGEASFAVAHDTSRPFRVRAGLNVVQAVGTKFVVNRLPSGTLISVTEGKVRVSSELPSPFREGLGSWLTSMSSLSSPTVTDDVTKSKQLDGPAALSAGDAVRVANNGRSLVSTEVSKESEASPQVRLLVFQQDTLADIAQEFNRYNTRQIDLPGGSVSQRRFSGVFHANDASSFLQYLECCAGLSVRDEKDRSVVSEKKTVKSPRQPDH